MDTMAEKSGYRVLQLPSHHCIFNSIEMIWAQLKQNHNISGSQPEKKCQKVSE